MADKRQSFCFRFPWSHSSRSKEESKPHSTPKTQNPANSTSKVVPDDQPPFRPAGKAPAKKASPLQSQETKNADASTSRAVIETPKTLSPSRVSPSNKSHVITQPSSLSQPLEEAVSSKPQDHRRKIEILSETDSSSEDSTSHNGIEISASSDKSADTLIQLSESETESKEHEEAKTAAHATGAEDKTSGVDTEPLQESIDELHVAAAKDSINQTNEAQSQAEQQQHEKPEKVTESNPAATDSGQHEEAALQAEHRHKKHERSSSSSTAEQVVPPPKKNKDSRDDISGVDKLAISSQMRDQPVGVVTLTGENKGAAMHLSSEPQKQEQPVGKLDQDDDDDNAANYTTPTDEQQQPMTMTCINSNVQSVNNSIVCNASVTERSPGVTIGAFPPESIMVNKAQPDRLTHQSTVRRRCLRGLMMESDSEPHNPDKPRRHGCRYACGKQSGD